MGFRPISKTPIRDANLSWPGGGTEAGLVKARMAPGAHFLWYRQKYIIKLVPKIAIYGVIRGTKHFANSGW